MLKLNNANRVPIKSLFGDWHPVRADHSGGAEGTWVFPVGGTSISRIASCRCEADSG